MYCRYCKAKNRSSAEECVVCGKPFPKPDQPPSVILTAPPRPAQPPPVPEPSAAPSAAPQAERRPDPQPQAAARPEAATAGPIPTPAPAPAPTPMPSAAAPPQPFPSFAIDPDEYARRFPQPDHHHRSRTRRAVRTALFAFAWLAALGAGAWGARWVDDNGGVDATLSKLAAQWQPGARPAVASAPDTPAPDGDVTRQTQLRAAQAIGTPVERKATPQTADDRERPRQAAAKDEPAATSSGTSGTGTDANGKGGAAVAPSEPAAESNPKPAKPKKAAKSTEKIAAAKSASDSSGRSAASSKKSASSPAQKVARGREISRIQAQAAEELKKKTRKRRLAVEHRQAKKTLTYAAAGPQRVRHMLAQCEKLDGLFWREQCKWRICEGHWGKNGCPSYTRDKVAVD